jgi:hypothetical protein
MKIPNPKFQTPKEFQHPNSQMRNSGATEVLRFEIWSFLGAWNLEFGTF